ncbi:MAG: hypothetical protein HBSAPP03_13660 [Phycisphaerae bacterium]|nr:MAG: hypothetical protein HBSAPP03_13660 [Phycisphaerae bacterium]
MLACLGAGLAVAGAWLVTRPDRTPSPVSHGSLCPDLAARGNDAARIVIKKAGAEVVIERRDAGWTVASKGGYPASRDQVIDLVRALADATLLEERTSKPELYGRLRVEDPDGAGAASTMVRVEDASGGVMASVIVGNAQPLGDDQGFYTRRMGEARSYLASGAVRAEADPLAWVQRTITELRNERVRSARVRHPEGEIHVHRARASEQVFVLDGVPEGRELRDEYVMTRLAWALSYITFDDVAPAGSMTLDPAGALVMETRCFDGLLVTVRQWKVDGATWITLAAAFEAPPAPPADEGAASAPVTAPSADLQAEIDRLNAAWSPWVYKIPEYKATVLRSVMEDFLKPATPTTPTTPATPAAEGDVSRDDDAP